MLTTGELSRIRCSGITVVFELPDSPGPPGVGLWVAIQSAHI